MGHFWVYFGNFSAVRAQNGPKTWSIVVCTYIIYMLRTVWDFEPSRRRKNFSRGFACFALLCFALLACSDYSVRRTLIIIIIRKKISARKYPQENIRIFSAGNFTQGRGLAPWSRDPPGLPVGTLAYIPAQLP